MKCTVEGCKGTAARWRRCSRHGAPPNVVNAALDVYEADGLSAACAHADVSTTTMLRWASKHGRTSTTNRTGDPDLGLTGREAAREVGATYRQVDHWARSGLVGPSAPDPGSGAFRRYLPADVEALRVVARLVDVGMHPTALRDMGADERARMLKVLDAEGFVR